MCPITTPTSSNNDSLLLFSVCLRVFERKHPWTDLGTGNSGHLEGLDLPEGAAEDHPQRR